MTPERKEELIEQFKSWKGTPTLQHDIDNYIAHIEEKENSVYCSIDQFPEMIKEFNDLVLPDGYSFSKKIDSIDAFVDFLYSFEDNTRFGDFINYTPTQEDIDSGDISIQSFFVNDTLVEQDYDARPTFEEKTVIDINVYRDLDKVVQFIKHRFVQNRFRRDQMLPNQDAMDLEFPALVSVRMEDGFDRCGDFSVKEISVVPLDKLLSGAIVIG